MDRDRAAERWAALDVAVALLAVVGLVLAAVDLNTLGFVLGLAGAVVVPVAFARVGRVRVLHVVAVVAGIAAMVLSLVQTF